MPSKCQDCKRTITPQNLGYQRSSVENGKKLFEETHCKFCYFRIEENNDKKNNFINAVVPVGFANSLGTGR